MAIPSDGPPVTLLAPFSDQIWRRSLSLDPSADLFTAIVKNRGALLVAGAALEAGPGVREWLAGEPRLLAPDRARMAGVVCPGGRGPGPHAGGLGRPGDERAWTSLVGAPPSRADEFLRRLLARDEGQLARFFTTLASLPEARRTALLQGAPGDDPASVLASLYDAAREADAPWAPNDHPYQLSYADLPSVLLALSDLPLDRLPLQRRGCGPRW